MEVSGQLREPAALPPREYPRRTGYMAGWSPEAGRCGKKKKPALLGNEPRSSNP
jgi:hypothetical protein